jgi:N-acetylmuramoyl-L-alanine amidase
LYVREGPATTFKAVGYLKRDDIVVELESNPEGSWKRVRRLTDQLTGWCSVTYLVLISAPPPPPDEEPPPDDTTGIKYKVTADRLNVREGPGTNFKSLGYIKKNDVVDSLGENADGTWIRIRRSDGLIGWASARYLSVIATPPSDQPGVKYRITADKLHVREGPSTSYKSLGYVQRNEIVEAFNATTDNTWRQIRRSDGLVGWSSARYMVIVNE